MREGQRDCVWEREGGMEDGRKVRVEKGHIEMQRERKKKRDRDRAVEGGLREWERFREGLVYHVEFIPGRWAILLSDVNWFGQ